MTLMSKTKKKRPSGFKFFLGLIFAFIFCLIGLFLVSRNSILNNSNQINLILNTKPVLVISFNFVNQKNTIFSFPSNTYVDVAGGYGNYQIGKLFALDQQEKKQGKLITSTISNTLGIPIDGYLNFNQKELTDKENGYTREEFIRKKNSLFLTLPVFYKWQLPVIDTLKIIYFAVSVKGSRVNFINFFDSEVLIPYELPDSTKVFNIDYPKIDKVIKDTIEDTAVIKDDLKVEVLNSTSFLGLAEKGARIVENLGIRVINIGNTTNLKTSDCKIYAEEKISKTYTFARLKNIFQCISIIQTYPESRADVTIILGDKYRFLFEKE